MLLPDSEVDARLSSMDNLINRLRLTPTHLKRTEQRSEVLIPEVLDSEDESQPDSAAASSDAPSIDDLIDDAETRIATGTAHKAALRIMNSALTQAEQTIAEIADPVKLSKVADMMGKIANGIVTARTKQVESGQIRNQQQIIVYRPIVRDERSYQTVLASE